MAIKQLPVWRHLGGETHRCGTHIQVMEVVFPNGVKVIMRICPYCDRLVLNPNLH